MSDDPVRQLNATEARRLQWFRRVSRWCGGVAGIAGLVMVTLWLLRPPALTPLGTIWLWKANCAMCLALCGFALIFGAEPTGAARRWQRGLATFAGVFSVLSLIEYPTGLNFGIDMLLGGDPTLAHPGRMAPQTAAMCAMFAVAIRNLDRRRGRRSAIADASLIGAGMLLYSVMSGYLGRTVDVVGVATMTRMAPQSMIVATLVWTGVIFARADRGVFGILIGDARGSQVIRYFLPASIVAPVIIGSVRLWAEAQGWQASTFSISVFATVQGVLRICVIIALGYLLNRSETARRDEQTRRERAERMIAMCAWTQRVRWKGEWVPVDQFLKDRFGLEITHGISEEALEQQLLALDLVDPHDHQRVA